MKGAQHLVRRKLIHRSFVVVVSNYGVGIRGILCAEGLVTSHVPMTLKPFNGYAQLVDNPKIAAISWSHGVLIPMEDAITSSPVPVSPFNCASPPHRTPYGTASRFTGVGWNKRIKKWVAGIIVAGERRYLGSFDDEIAAAKAYDKAVREALGECAIAYLNFPSAIDRERGARLINRHEACCRFGVTIKTWWRWEREGKIKCGKRIGCGVKLYRIEDIEQLLGVNGAYSPPYPDPDRPGCYRVPLTGQDIRRREAIVDAESLPLVKGRLWCWSGTPDGRKGTVVQARNGETTPLRRIIMGLDEPVRADGRTNTEVCHINGDPLDCRRENLIVRSTQERTWSARKRRTHHGKPCSSRFKGVSWNPQNERWKSTIHVDCKTRHLGFFHGEIAAAKAYDEAARELFGEHAWLNFPDAGERGNFMISASLAAA